MEATNVTVAEPETPGKFSPAIRRATMATASDVAGASIDAGTSVEIRPTGHDLRSSPMDDREAILKALYADRSRLVDAELLRPLSTDEASHLQDINREIARWQGPDTIPGNTAVWRQLDELAARTIDIHARIERALQKGK